jgi:transcriptional regulator with XRE-family HTH domain
MTADDFKAWRERMGLTQQAAAEALGLSLRTVQGYEASVGELSVLVKLACERLESGSKRRKR